MEELEEQILGLVARLGGGVSFAELMSHCENAAGDRTLYSADNRNVVLWQGLSRSCIEALQKLIEEEQIELAPTSVLVYGVDGVGLDLPVVKRQYRYKTPHWLPVVLNLGEAAKAP